MVEGISTNAAAQTQNNPNIESKLKSAGVPTDIIAQGREAVMEYCKENNITLPQPPQQNAQSGSIFGNAQLQQGVEEEAPAELQAELASLGVPTDVIAQGREAVMQYCQDNNIQMPEPPERPEEGGNLDFSA